MLSGRTAFSSNLKTALVEKHGGRCSIYLESFPERELQIDHRVPFEIAGDSGAPCSDIGEYMLVCASANRAKSWSCEHSENWMQKKVETCRSCYWASPESYVAMQDIRRLDVLWLNEEAPEYDELRQQAARSRQRMPEYAKSVLRDHLSRKKSDEQRFRDRIMRLRQRTPWFRIAGVSRYRSRRSTRISTRASLNSVCCTCLPAAAISEQSQAYRMASHGGSQAASSVRAVCASR